jgi:predicted enzyme related to lactoylglutathione lyase
MKITLSILSASVLLFTSCIDEGDINNVVESIEPIEETQPETSSLISLFEIPAENLSRAVSFYRNVLDLEIEEMEVPGMKMGVFPYENQAVSGIIIEAEGSVPSADGTVIYFNAGDDLQSSLEKVKENGGEIIVPKTEHADESGFFAIIHDTEGNRVGLNSPN